MPDPEYFFDPGSTDSPAEEYYEEILFLPILMGLS